MGEGGRRGLLIVAGRLLVKPLGAHAATAKVIRGNS